MTILQLFLAILYLLWTIASIRDIIKSQCDIVDKNGYIQFNPFTLIWSLITLVAVLCAVLNYIPWYKKIF